MCDLTICKLSDFTSTVDGGKEIIMLCDKVVKGESLDLILSLSIDVL